MRTRQQNERGFTLLELLMVVIIVGILASLALPGYIRSAERSRSSEAVTYLGQLKGATQRYCMQADSAEPTVFADLDVDDLEVQDPNGFGARWSVAFPAVVCDPTFTFTAAASRDAGPCVGSSVTLTYPVGVSGQEFTYLWSGPCA